MFKYTIFWVDPKKQRRYAIEVGGNHALFVAKKKASEGMQEVTISVEEINKTADPSDDT